MLAILEFTREDEERGFTTVDIAQEIGAKEYQVRVAFSWLMRFGKIEIVPGELVRRTTRTAGEKYPVNIYRLKPKAETTVEFLNFYMRFCGGR